MKVAELFAELGVKNTGKTAMGEFISSMGIARTSTEEVVDRLKSLGETAFYGLNTANESALAFANFAAATGMSAVELQRFTQAGTAFNITQEETIGVLGKLQSLLTKVRTNQGGGALFSALRINPGEFGFKSDRVFLELMKRGRQGMDPALYSQLMGNLGIPENMMRMFANPGGFSRAFSAATPMSGRDMNTALAFVKEWQKVVVDFKILVQETAVVMDQYLTPFLTMADTVFQSLKASGTGTGPTPYRAVVDQLGLGLRYGLGMEGALFKAAQQVTVSVVASPELSATTRVEAQNSVTKAYNSIPVYESAAGGRAPSPVSKR